VLIGLASALAASAAYGTTQTIARSLVTGTAPASVSATYTIFFGMFLLLAMSAPNLRKDLRAPRSALVMMSIAGICSSFGVFFMFTALSLAPVTLASPIGALNPLVAMALTHVFLQRVERITPRMVAGGVLVVIGVTLVVLGQA
jgi:drug/metabolite transporter (DMT)-like permease